MFHRIYESMGLGMHPASLYPRRSRVAPEEESRAPDQRIRRRQALFIVRLAHDGVKRLCRLKLSPFQS